MNRFGPWFVLLSVVLAVGCKPEPPPPPPKKMPPSAADAKSVLQDFTNTGRINSGLATLDGYIAILRTSDPAKADAIADEVRQLVEASGENDAEAVKAKAQEIAEKL